VEGAKTIPALPEMLGPEAFENQTAVGCLLNSDNIALVHPFPSFLTEGKNSPLKHREHG
jgi:hypothetical protein